MTGHRRQPRLRREVVRPDPVYLRHALKVAAKEAIWLATNRHLPSDQPDICLFASHRGGSTWLMEIIASEPGVRYLHEPFGSWFGLPAQTRLMPKYENGHPVHFMSAREEEEFRRYTDELFAGRAVVNAPWEFWRRGYTFRSNRLVLKILEAKALIDWFDQNYDVQIVYLTRNPLPTSLSRLRNNWGTASKAYLDNEWFRDEVLTRDQVDLSRRIMREGSPLEQQLLTWSVENLIPLRLLPERPHWIFVSYEECVQEPEATVRRLSQRLGLTSLADLQAAHTRPSRTTGFSDSSTRAQLELGDRRGLLTSWRNRLGTDDEKRLLAIPEAFGIALYLPGEDAPTPWWDVS